MILFLDVGIVRNITATQFLNYYINGMNRFVRSIMNQLHFNSFEPEWLAEHLNYMLPLSIIAFLTCDQCSRCKAKEDVVVEG